TPTQPHFWNARCPTASLDHGRGVLRRRLRLRRVGDSASLVPHPLRTLPQCLRVRLRRRIWPRRVLLRFSPNVSGSGSAAGSGRAAFSSASRTTSAVNSVLIDAGDQRAGCAAPNWSFNRKQASPGGATSDRANRPSTADPATASFPHLHRGLPDAAEDSDERGGGGKEENKCRLPQDVPGGRKPPPSKGAQRICRMWQLARYCCMV
ncbi:unnamed protein product, partial [Urochloa humidicola]